MAQEGHRPGNQLGDFDLMNQQDSEVRPIACGPVLGQGREVSDVVREDCAPIVDRKHQLPIVRVSMFRVGGMVAGQNVEFVGPERGCQTSIDVFVRVEPDATRPC